MIAVTGNAIFAIQHMTNTEVYPNAGLRIRKVDHRKFAVTIVPTPAADDVAVPIRGANLYLDRMSVAALDNATLDAGDNTRRTDEFVLENVV